MRKLVLVSTLGLALGLAAPAGAVNHPFVPANECSPSSNAGGVPAAANNQTPTWAANPRFSENNPGASTGAQGGEKSSAVGNCADTR